MSKTSILKTAVAIIEKPIFKDIVNSIGSVIDIAHIKLTAPHRTKHKTLEKNLNQIIRLCLRLPGSKKDDSNIEAGILALQTLELLNLPVHDEDNVRKSLKLEVVTK